jgi:cytochrome c nitrite reductase small subunit
MKPAFFIILGALAGVSIGLGLYTFAYARGYSYLTNNPQACTNCHVMQEYYDAWIKSPHRSVAACNDCHTPHNFVGKYATKIENGFAHSFAFTSGWYPDNILIRPRDYRVAEGTCRSCHEAITQAIVGEQSDSHHNSADIDCIRCHFDVGHSAANFVKNHTHQTQEETRKDKLREASVYGVQ